MSQRPPSGTRESTMRGSPSSHAESVTRYNVSRPKTAMRDDLRRPFGIAGRTTGRCWPTSALRTEPLDSVQYISLPFDDAKRYFSLPVTLCGYLRHRGATGLPVTPGILWSGRPDSNRRRPAWEAGILPLNYGRSTSPTIPRAVT